VTPLNEVPIIPKATNIQLLFLLPMKNDMLLLFLPVILATPNNTKKYRITNIKRVVALIVDDLSF
jgi:hypothetical protein